MKFHDFKERLSENFGQITILRNAELFETDADKDRLWQIYLDSFPAGSNPLYRTKTEHDCSCCRHFIKEIGRVVWFDDDLKPHSIFDFPVKDQNYQKVMDALNEYVVSCRVIGKYMTKELWIGTDVTRERLEDGTVIQYEHYIVKIPDRMVYLRDQTVDTEKGKFRDTRNVFKRSLDEITLEAMQTVLELINSNTLYKGGEWKTQIEALIGLKRMYDSLGEDQKEAFCWVKASAVGPVLGRIRNHSIGVLLTNISEGMDLDAAVRAYEKIVAPANYKRPKAIYSKRMLEDAQKTVVEMGYMDSLARRYATLDDITVNNILFSNRDSAKRISGNVFEEMAEGMRTDPKKFSRAEEIGIDKFLSDVLPDAAEVEAFVENRHEPNFVSLIAPVNRDAKSMFKWSNGFSWAYAGNLTDSDIRENVKSACGRVDGVLRFSIQWNDLDEWDENDVDAHCITPSGSEIYFSHKVDLRTRGNLDVDIINPGKGIPAVENITFPDKRWMIPGAYDFFVQCYSSRGGKSGFRAEIEFGGQIYRYDYREPLRQGQKVPVAIVDLLGEGGMFSIREILPSQHVSRDIWGIKTNTFTPVSVVMNSPNYWDDQKGIGHKHFFFMLKNCLNSENPNGFYNEFLSSELIEHKKVFEALGSKMAVAPSEDQLSGIGFSSTKRNELVVRVRGRSNTERIFKIKF